MDIRAQILNHATRLFAEQGYDGTSVQQIADAVGIRKPSLLYHFKSKDELRENVIAEMLAHWNAVLPGLLLKASTEERFDATMEALTEFFIEDPDRARLFLRETLDRPESMQAMLREFVKPWLELLGSQLERAKEQGLVQPDVDPYAYAVEHRFFRDMGKELAAARDNDAMRESMARLSKLSAGTHGAAVKLLTHWFEQQSQ